MNRETLVGHLEKLWSENKAKGFLAQVLFRREITSGSLSSHRRKFFGGCWVLTPKTREFFKFRFTFFTHPALLRDSPSDTLEPEDILGGADGLKFQMIAGFLRRAGIGVLYAIPVGADITHLEQIRWLLYRYDTKDEKLKRVNPNIFFSRWRGVGKPPHGEAWSDEVREAYMGLEEEELTMLLLNEAFFAVFIKQRYRKTVKDPYDIDGFLLSYSTGSVLPLEIKEKFPAKKENSRFFGLDAGRILLLLRLCLPNDANALYVIREVKREDRGFIGWKFMPLSDIIATASWVLLHGGRGMSREETHIVALPYDSFRVLDSQVLSNDYLGEIASLPEEIKRLANEFRDSLEREFFREEQGGGHGGAKT